jgi:L-alanine-DL-glutamate epimerase-like enolase superfamily enzyme
MNCEIHCTLMGPMDIANLHVSCAIPNSEYFELHMPDAVFKFPMVEDYPLDERCVIWVPQRPGLGISIDWDAVDDASYFRIAHTL